MRIFCEFEYKDKQYKTAFEVADKDWQDGLKLLSIWGDDIIAPQVCESEGHKLLPSVMGLPDICERCKEVIE